MMQPEVQPQLFSMGHKQNALQDIVGFKVTWDWPRKRLKSRGQKVRKSLYANEAKFARKNPKHKDNTEVGK